MTGQSKPAEEGNPFQDLRDEHAGIQLMLSILKKVSRRLLDGAEIPSDHLKRMHEFLKTFADRCHHGKEEDILFPELEGISENKPLLIQLLGEHKSGRDLIRGMGESLEHYHPASAEAVHLAVNMEEYVALLDYHIQTENKQLFPAADRQLSHAQKDELAEKFEILERDVIGVGRHEEFHRWLEEFKQIYLD